MVLSGVPHEPPGAIAPWKMPGGAAALKAQRAGRRGASQMVVGVGGPRVPVVQKSFALAKVRARRASQAEKADQAERVARAAGATAAEVKNAREIYAETVRGYA